VSTDFHLAYPDETAPTVEFAPESGPEVGSSITERDGLSATVMADGSVVVYELAEELLVYEYVFSSLTEAELAEWDTFRDTVGGNAFRVRDDTALDYTTMRLAPDAFRRERTFSDLKAGDEHVWALTLRFIASDVPVTDIVLNEPEFLLVDERWETGSGEPDLLIVDERWEA
jgi:hypothetical protein